MTFGCYKTLWTYGAIPMELCLTEFQFKQKSRNDPFWPSLKKTLTLLQTHRSCWTWRILRVVASSRGTWSPTDSSPRRFSRRRSARSSHPAQIEAYSMMDWWKIKKCFKWTLSKLWANVNNLEEEINLKMLPNRQWSQSGSSHRLLDYVRTMGYKLLSCRNCNHNQQRMK